MPDYSGLNGLLQKSCKIVAERFDNSISDVKINQTRKLMEIVSANEDTDFGKSRNFGKIKSVEDFRSYVPILSYEDYEDYITQIALGKNNVLTADEVIMLEPTSGSTSPSKFIPYTNSLRNDFQNGIFPWIYNILAHKSRVASGSFYWSITPAAHRQERTSGGIPIGFGDDGSYFTDEQRILLQELSAVPFNVSQIQDIDEFRDKTLSYLLKNKDLSFISVWNPTFLSLLLRPVKNPSLEWPNLSLISAWADGNSAYYVEEIRRLFPNVEIQPKGLISTEAFVSFPIPNREGSALSINSHFFEFKSLEDEQDVRLAHELEINKEYGVVVTTSGGLYRYNLEDIIKVVGFEKQCPLIKFVGRNNNVSDLFGEKLNERHVSGLIQKVFEKNSLSPKFFMLAPEVDDNTPSYVLFIESDKFLDSAKISSEVDAGLQDNYHYRYCRQLGQLGKPKVFLIEPNNKSTSSDIYLEKCHSKGKKIGNVKPVILSPQTGWKNMFKGHFLD